MSEKLVALLEQADADDLRVLADILTDNGQGRISLSDDTCKALVNARGNASALRKLAPTIANEIELFGGNSIINLFRGRGVSYDGIVCDVADHFKVNYNKGQDIPSIELQILIKVLEKSFQEMSDEQKQELLRELSDGDVVGFGPAGFAALVAIINAGGFASYRLALVVANATARQLTGKGLAFAANAGLTRAISVVAGPIGWAITAVWTAFDLASPAYRVTVPAVIQTAYIRQKSLKLKNSNQCPQCKADNKPNAKFCSECGNKLNS